MKFIIGFTIFHILIIFIFTILGISYLNYENEYIETKCKILSVNVKSINAMTGEIYFGQYDVNIINENINKTVLICLYTSPYILALEKANNLHPVGSTMICWYHKNSDDVYFDEVSYTNSIAFFSVAGILCFCLPYVLFFNYSKNNIELRNEKQIIRINKRSYVNYV